MNPENILARLRQFLSAISCGVFVMTVIELVFIGHWNKTIQFLPFTLSGLGLLTLIFARWRPSRRSINALRWSMIVIAACSFIGVFEHMARNLEFWLEIEPDATPWELIAATVNGGIPILAPGILLLGAVIGLTAVYRHPLLENQ